MNAFNVRGNRCCALTLGLFVLVAAAQAQTVKSQDLSTKIKSGDATAMLEAGRQKEFAVIPLLRQQLSGSKSGAALWALAKLGDRQAQQDLWCKYIGSKPAWEYTSAFEYVGGWLGIRGLDVFLTPAGERGWYRLQASLGKAEKHSDTSTVVHPSHDYALRSLEKLVPDFPTKGRKLQGDDALKMHRWIW